MFVKKFRLLHPNRALDELEVALQIVLGQMTGQRDDFAALLVPGLEQAVEAEIALVSGLFVEVVENFQASVSAVANAVFVLSRASSYWWRRIEASMSDRFFQLIVFRVSSGPGVIVPGEDVVECQPHGRVADRVRQLLQNLGRRSKTRGK